MRYLNQRGIGLVLPLIVISMIGATAYYLTQQSEINEKDSAHRRDKIRVSQAFDNLQVNLARKEFCTANFKGERIRKNEDLSINLESIKFENNTDYLRLGRVEDGFKPLQFSIVLKKNESNVLEPYLDVLFATRTMESSFIKLGNSGFRIKQTEEKKNIFGGQSYKKSFKLNVEYEADGETISSCYVDPDNASLAIQIQYCNSIPGAEWNATTNECSITKIVSDLKANIIQEVCESTGNKFSPGTSSFPNPKCINTSRPSCMWVRDGNSGFVEINASDNFDADNRADVEKCGGDYFVKRERIVQTTILSQNTARITPSASNSQRLANQPKPTNLNTYTLRVNKAAREYYCCKPSTNAINRTRPRGR